jgi:hypothetical protein
MFIKLITMQIPMFWETIKFSCKNADMIQPKNYQVYFNELLHALLSDKAQCFVRLDDKRKILAILITRVTGHKITGEKSLCLQSGYSFEAVPQNIWQEDFKILLDVAIKNDCKSITFDTSNEALANRALGVGCEEVTRSYEYSIGGA